MASATTSWMPTHGKVPVTIGSSLNRALKARKQAATPPATNPKRSLHDRDFYSFRYNFKPPAVDLTKTGTIEVKKGKEKTQVLVEHASSQAGESYVFAGTETSAKEWDVVLIFDDETGGFTLEKLDSLVNLKWERKQTSGRAQSPVAQSPADMDAEGENDEEFEEELMHLAGGPPAKQKPRPSKLPQKPKPAKEEEEEEEEIPIPPIQEPVTQLPPKPQSQPQPVKSRPMKPLPKQRNPSTAMAVDTPSSSAPAPTPASSKPKTGQKPPKKKKQPEVQDNYPEVEEIPIGGLAKQAKQPAAPSAGLALPGSSNSGMFIPPPPPTLPAKPRTTQQQQPVTTVEDDSEEEWEEIPPHAEPSPDAEPSQRALSYHSDEGGDVGELFSDEEADLDEELEDQLKQELERDLTTTTDKVPLSWDQLAAVSGGLEDDSEEDFSSSDDSDED